MVYIPFAGLFDFLEITRYPRRFTIQRRHVYPGYLAEFRQAVEVVFLIYDHPFAGNNRDFTARSVKERLYPRYYLAGVCVCEPVVFDQGRPDVLPACFRPDYVFGRRWHGHFLRQGKRRSRRLGDHDGFHLALYYSGQALGKRHRQAVDKRCYFFGVRHYLGDFPERIRNRRNAYNADDLVKAVEHRIHHLKQNDGVDVGNIILDHYNGVFEIVYRLLYIVGNDRRLEIRERFLYAGHCAGIRLGNSVSGGGHGFFKPAFVAAGGAGIRHFGPLCGYFPLLLCESLLRQHGV